MDSRINLLRRQAGRAVWLAGWVNAGGNRYTTLVEAEVVFCPVIVSCYRGGYNWCPFEGYIPTTGLGLKEKRECIERCGIVSVVLERGRGEVGWDCGGDINCWRGSWWWGSEVLKEEEKVREVIGGDELERKWWWRGAVIQTGWGDDCRRCRRLRREWNKWRLKQRVTEIRDGVMVELSWCL